MKKTSSIVAYFDREAAWGLAVLGLTLAIYTAAVIMQSRQPQDSPTAVREAASAKAAQADDHALSD